MGMVSAGSSVAFNHGNDKLTFSRTSGHFETDQAGYNYGGTAFANVTVLVGAGDSRERGTGGTIMLQFAVPVIQFGMNIEDFVDADSGSGNYSISFLAYDAGGNLIGNTDALGVFNPPRSIPRRDVRTTHA